MTTSPFQAPNAVSMSRTITKRERPQSYPRAETERTMPIEIIDDVR